jgi:hypothetical protein
MNVMMWDHVLFYNYFWYDKVYYFNLLLHGSTALEEPWSPIM